MGADWDGLRHKPAVLHALGLSENRCAGGACRLQPCVRGSFTWLPMPWWQHLHHGIPEGVAALQEATDTPVEIQCVRCFKSICFWPCSYSSQWKMSCYLRQWSSYAPWRALIFIPCLKVITWGWGRSGGRVASEAPTPGADLGRWGGPAKWKQFPLLPCALPCPSKTP